MKEKFTFNPNTDTLVYALGGLEEVGKNMYCFEHKDEIVIVDCGVKFPDDNLPGIDYIIPDYSYLIKNQEKIKALVITHGHEDHIGGIPFFLSACPNVKIYATSFAKSLIEKKLEERKKLKDTTIELIDEDSCIKTKYFTIGFFNTIHSIPDSVGVLINTPNGKVIETGDFKFDLTPTGQNSDYQKMAFIGASGVTLLMSDSTNSEVDGFSISEKKVANSIEEITKKLTGRLIISTFASNVNRLTHIIKSSVKNGRKVVVFGRSMENVVEIGLKSKTIDVPESSFVDPKDMNNVDQNKLTIVCTGSQGEAMAALSRIADGTHKYVKLIPGDTVVFSSNPIPGNAIYVSSTVDKLVRQGAKVIVNSTLTSLHTTGHASKDEQKLMIQLIKPKYFEPIHGEYKMLKMHKQTAIETGIPEQNCFICANGDALALRKEKVYKCNYRVQTDAIYVDGSDYTGLSTSVIKDRKILGDNGMVSVLIYINSAENKVMIKPNIITRGFVYAKENQDLINEAEIILYSELQALFKKKVTFSDIKMTAKNTLESYFYEKTNRNPIIIPVILNDISATKKPQ